MTVHYLDGDVVIGPSRSGRLIKVGTNDDSKQ